ncbi:hypothetical protein CNEO4_10036 [Clostridium neonatale]|nr:hypothetical protein CNEO4_10036 [Clostridium neonatale]
MNELDKYLINITEVFYYLLLSPKNSDTYAKTDKILLLQLILSVFLFLYYSKLVPGNFTQGSAPLHNRFHKR